jgi:4-hydroxy-4-methyl-2-oxoglutarate aldolase
MVKSFTKGCVQLRSGHGSYDCGHFGEINATAARASGCDGVVLDGSTRDSNFILDMDYPVFCRFRSPVESLSRLMYTDYQVNIYVRGTDGLLKVHPGDYVFGDNDGVVIIPKELTVPVLEKAEKIELDEAESRRRIANGEDPLEVFYEVGRF